MSLKFVPKGPINNTPALVQIMAWRRPGDKPLSEPMMVSLPTHICVTRPQWVNKRDPWKSHKTSQSSMAHEKYEGYDLIHNHHCTCWWCDGVVFLCIKLTSHERQGVWNKIKTRSFVQQLVKVIYTGNIKHPYNLTDAAQKGTVLWKAFPWLAAIMVTNVTLRTVCML